MRNNELIELVRDVESLYRNDGWQHLQPAQIAELLAMVRHALELEPVARVRSSDPSTSRKAAESVALRSGSQRHRLLEQYVNAGSGLTDEQAGQRAGLAQFGVCYWKRCSELRNHGFIEPLGFTRLASTGEQQQVCGITDAGRVVLERFTLARTG